MAPWPARYQLSYQDRLRRSLYEVLRDQVERCLVEHALIDSYWRFQRAGQPYPFVEKRELKPRAKTKQREFPLHNSFLVIFCEDSIPGRYKKYIRFFDTNKVTKEQMKELADIELSRAYHKNLRYLDHPEFADLMIDLLAVDYALLIQRDPAVKRKTRYLLSHFHVKIDWPIDDATEEMAKELRYVSKELYEHGEEYAQGLHQKLFERYGFHHTVGGRRTAAVVAAQFLQRMDFASTVYVASTEARNLTCINERGVTRFILLPVPMPEIDRLAEESRTGVELFSKRFVLDRLDDRGVCLFEVLYEDTSFARAPEDWKVRRLRPDFNWKTVTHQFLIPLPGYPDVGPMPYKTVYVGRD